MRELVLVLLLSACSKDEDLTRLCGRECAVLADGSFLPIEDFRTGFCSAGEVLCAGGLADQCVGFRPAQDEVCDGKDNNCDGLVDEDLSRPARGPTNTCYITQHGVCADAAQYCADGRYRCLNEVVPSFGPEVCDGLDNDCDGTTDEEISDEYFYTGPADTALVGTCRPGFRRCSGGSFLETPEVKPASADVCGDGLDNDCDGLTDEPEDGRLIRSLSLIVDFSGSMDPFLSDIIVTLCTLPNTSPNLVQVIGVGVPTSVLSNLETVSLTDGFVPVTDACLAVLAVAGQGGNEFVTRAALATLEPYAPFSFSPLPPYPAGTHRTVVMFTDEPLHESNIGDLAYEQGRLLAHCNDPGDPVDLRMFASLASFGDYDPFVYGCPSADLYPLGSSLGMQQVLVSLLEGGCT